MKRDLHSLSHYKLLSLKAGELVPVACVEALPGDTFQHHSSVLLRASPLLAPVMHPFHVRLHHFFVPLRLLWTGWENFITGVDATPPPTLTASSGRVNGDLLDHLGVPPVNSTTAFSAFPVRAYNKIYNEFFRDQDLIGTQVPQDTLTVQKVAWGKDMFTAARPWAQKGGAVSLPLGTEAPVKTSSTDKVTGTQTQLKVFKTDGTNPAAGPLGTSATGLVGVDTIGHVSDEAVYPRNLYADLTTATAATVRDVRLAFALQNYNEARAQYGSRYVEYLRSAFGVRSSDGRLDRPEYLGGGKQTVSFSEVLQTAEGTAAVGTMRGHGIAGMRSGRYRRFFEEHGLVISLLSVRPKSIYVNGLYKMWSRTTKEDYFQRELQFIGQQAVLNKEVDFRNDGSDGATFGYANRYQEYREHPSMIHGDFRSSLLNFWHVARDFAARPALNQTFIECDPATRIFAVSTNDTLWCAVNHHIAARRPVSRSTTARII